MSTEMTDTLEKKEKKIKILPLIFLSLCSIIFLLWCIGMIWYCSGHIDPKWKILLCAGFAGLILTLFALSTIKSFFRWIAWGIMMMIAGIYLAIPPSNDRQWCQEYSRIPWAEKVDTPDGGKKWIIHDVRDFVYRSETDFDPRYCDITVDPAHLQSLDFIVVHWDGLKSIAHTMLDFGFSDGQRLVFSVETRRDIRDIDGIFPGIYKQYEIACVVGTESDLLRLRTDHRKEELYLYPTNATAEQRCTIFESLLERINQLYSEPAFYHTLTFNCTKSLLPSIRQAVKLPLSRPSYLLNGFSDFLAYKLDFLANPQKMSFEELKKNCHVNPVLDRQDQTDRQDYSKMIRDKYPENIINPPEPAPEKTPAGETQNAA